MTTPITSWTRATCREAAEAMTAALQTVAQAHGLTITYRGGSFAPLVGTFTARFECAVAEVGGTPTEQAAFERDCAIFDLTPADYRTPFVVKGVAYQLVGFNLRRAKYPLRAKGPTGREVLFTRDVLRLIQPPTRMTATLVAGSPASAR